MDRRVGRPQRDFNCPSNMALDLSSPPDWRADRVVAAALRGPGESYSDVILRLIAIERA